MFIIDAHLDLAYSALNFGRKLTQPLAPQQAYEIDHPTADGVITVTLPNLIKGQVGLVFATIYVTPQSSAFATDKPITVYNDIAPMKIRQAFAHEKGMAQFDFYMRLVDEIPQVIIVKNWADVERVQASYATENPLIGLLIHIEGADPIQDPSQLPMWVEYGLRSIGLAWADTRYAPGQWAEQGRLYKDGYALLERAAEDNLLIDLTHMSEEATYDVLDAYDGPIAITHTGARGINPIDRLASDKQIRLVAERDGVLGMVMFNDFLKAGHRQGLPKENVTLEHLVAHIDYICQMLGNADHVGIGSDMDGGLGLDDIPLELRESADLHLIATALAQKGYDQTHIENIMHGNWLRLLRRVLD